MEHWEDRISEENHKAASNALKAFRASNRGRSAQDKAYEALTNAGCTPEEADEILNLEAEDD